MYLQQRSGKIFLRPDVSFEDALVCSINTEPKPLTVTPDGGIDIICDKLPCYSSISRAQDNYGFSVSLLNSNPGSCFSLFDPRFEIADMIVVSQRCANYINAKILLIQFGQQDETYRLNLLDKFYIPFNVVYANRRSGSSSQGFTGHKPIGAIGLQKISSYLDLSFYAAAIEKNLTVSLPGVCCAAIAYTCMPIPQRYNFNFQYGYKPENKLRVVNDYLAKRGYTPYNDYLDQHEYTPY